MTKKDQTEDEGSAVLERKLDLDSIKTEEESSSSSESTEEMHS